MQTKIHAVLSLVPEPCPFHVKTAIQRLKMYKAKGTDQIPAEGETLCSQIHKQVNSIWCKEEVAQRWMESLIVPIYTKGDTTDCSNYQGNQGTSPLAISHKILFSIIFLV
jgi:hypothetical protein